MSEDEDRARGYFDQARALLRNTTVTPGEKAVACAALAVAAAVIDIRDALTGQGADELTEAEGAMGYLAYELKRFNDGHDYD